MSDEENTPQAPGIAAAWAQPEEPAEGAPRRRRGVGPDPMEKLRNWNPKTQAQTNNFLTDFHLLILPLIFFYIHKN